MRVSREELDRELGERVILREWKTEYGCDMREVSYGGGRTWTESDGNGVVPEADIIEALKNLMEGCSED